jgi:hypothetical protein
LKVHASQKGVATTQVLADYMSLGLRGPGSHVVNGFRLFTGTRLMHGFRVDDGTCSFSGCHGPDDSCSSLGCRLSDDSCASLGCRGLTNARSSFGFHKEEGSRNFHGFCKLSGRVYSLDGVYSLTHAYYLGVIRFVVVPCHWFTRFH